jgi:hypothetical protein
LCGGRSGVHPIHDLLERFRVGMDGRFIEQNVFGLFQSRGHHKLGAVRADKLRRLVDDRPLLSADRSLIFGEYHNVLVLSTHYTIRLRYSRQSAPLAGWGERIDLSNCADYLILFAKPDI